MKNNQTQNSWDLRIKILSNILGFQYKDEQNLQETTTRSKGFIKLKGKVSRSSINQSSKSQLLNVCQQWESIMKFPPKYCRKRVLQLLKTDIYIDSKIWNWLLQNNQKISHKLYNSRRSQYLQVISNNNICSPRNNHLRTIINSYQLNKHEGLAYTIGAYLLHREDMCFGVGLYNIAASCYYYTQSNQLITFQLICHIGASPIFLGFLTKDEKQKIESIKYIINKLKHKCSSIVFLNCWKNLTLDLFIETWIQTFFYPICQNGSKVKCKVLAYLLLQNFSKEAVCRVCQATIIASSRILNQGNSEKCIEVLNNPKLFIDEQLFIEYLLE